MLEVASLKGELAVRLNPGTGQKAHDLWVHSGRAHGSSFCLGEGELDGQRKIAHGVGPEKVETNPV